MKNSRLKYLLILGIVITLIAGIGSTYSFFIYRQEGSNVSLQSGEISINYSDNVNYISVPDAYPVSDEVGKIYPYYSDFTINGVTDKHAIKYEIQIVPNDGNTIDTKYIKVYLTDQNDNPITEPILYDDLEKATYNDNGKIVYTGYFGKTGTKNYRLRVWIDESYDKNLIETFGFNIYLYSVNDYAKLLYNTLETSLASNLTEPDIDGTRYVRGETINNNYVWYSGKMWRIVALNSDGTVKLVTQNNMTAITWATNSSNIDYSTSQIRSWLKNEFLPTIKSNLIVESNWDYTLYSNFPSSKITENVIEVNDKVGLISIYDYMMTGGTNDTSTSSTFLNNGYEWWTMSLNDTLSWRVYAGGFATNVDYPVNDGKGCGVRPSVNLKSDITLTGEGNGELETPYMLEEDTQIGQASELLSSRISGEYIKFNNVKYRIVGTENGLTKVTMTDYSVNNNSIKFYQQFGETADESGAIFNINSGIGKYLNDWYNGNILNNAYKAMIATSENDGIVWYQGPDIGGWGDYTLSKTGPEIKTTVGLGSYGEMFASQYGTGESGSMWTWLMTKYSSIAVHFIGAIGDVNIQIPNVEYAVRPSFYLKSDVKIESGSGLPNDPYEIYQDTLAHTFSTKLAANLTEPDVDGTRYVYGNTVDNNYVWYSGKMWRIVALNSNGTVKLVTQNNMSAVAWATSENTDYSNSQIRSWLNSEFINTLNTNLIVDSVWDYTVDSELDMIKPEIDTTKTLTENVGLLTIYEYMMSLHNSNDYSSTYLCNNYYWWTMTPQTDNSLVWYISDVPSVLNGPAYARGVRPAVVLTSDIQLIGGTGKLSDPYILDGDTITGKVNASLNTRISGEYIKFNNVLYRIIGTEIINGERLTKVTMGDYTMNNNTLTTSLAFGESNKELTFSPTYGIGLYLEEWYQSNNINSTYKAMIATKDDGVSWYVGPDSGGVSSSTEYTLAKTGTPIPATIGLGRYGEIFSSQFGGSGLDSVNIWLITKYSDYHVWRIAPSSFLGGMGPTNTYGVRPSFYLKSDVKITGGTGMPHDPYTISQ